MRPILEIKNLQVAFDTYAGEVKAVRGVSYTVNPGEAVAVVGESGCGKSVTAQTVMGLIPSPPGRVVAGQILFDGQDLLNFTERQMQGVRGNQIGMIFQDPMTSLNPTMTVGRQIAEGLRKHQSLPADQALEQAKEMLKMVGIPHPDRRLNQYPHEFSGGMRQRAMIATALACRPKLLIADEPTTALDVTIQDQIIDLMRNLQRQLGMAIVLITHDLGVVAGLCSRVVVMYAGQIMEAGPVREIYYRTQHPYTRGLLASVPKTGKERKPLVSIPGTPPDLFSPPPGCPFAPRCSHAMKVCGQLVPQEQEVSPGHRVACWLTHPLAQYRKQEVAG
ncbi:MAG: ABC transporter ATP-binding protein [Clostridia bacterium]|nr:ABC transporter ATP-binding protein [Clostridia bacterium]